MICSTAVDCSCMVLALFNKTKGSVNNCLHFGIHADESSSILKIMYTFCLIILLNIKKFYTDPLNSDDGIHFLTCVC